MAGDINVPRAKVERAKRHIQEVHGIIREFLAKNPYEVVTDDHSEPGKKIYKLTRVDPPPPDLALAVGDAIHNLRSALDLLFGQLVLANGKTINKADMFQIADSAELFKAGGVPKIKGRVSDKAVELICRLRPYKGGNDALWRLHRLDIADKHRVLYVVGSAYRAFKPAFPPLDLPGGEPINFGEMFPDVFFKPADRQFPLEEGDVLYIEPDDFKTNEQPQFRFDVAFGEFEVVEGEPIIETLNDLLGMVEQTVDLFAPLLGGSPPTHVASPSKG